MKSIYIFVIVFVANVLEHTFLECHLRHFKALKWPSVHSVCTLFSKTNKKGPPRLIFPPVHSHPYWHCKQLKHTKLWKGTSDQSSPGTHWGLKKHSPVQCLTYSDGLILLEEVFLPPFSPFLSIPVYLISLYSFIRDWMTN